MTFAASGPLSVKDLKGDLETRAKNFLKLNISDNNGFLHSSELIEEIDFLMENGYAVKKQGAKNLMYEATSKGREYVGKRD